MRVVPGHLLPLLIACFSLIATTAQAQTHPWIVKPPKLAPEAYFSNLTPGQEIETPAVIKFGLTGIGIAAITKPVKKAGHHHLLVNRELPMDFTKPLPFTDQYIHFGKGQMEAVVNFVPGDYTLRLVFADHRHIPNFVYSPPVKIKVTAQNKSVDPKTLTKPGVEILSPKQGETLKPPMRVIFHASGLNVSHTEIQEANTGHFRLTLEQRGGRSETFTFTDGNTEVWLQPPVGAYSARLDLIDNTTPGKVLGSSAKVDFNIGSR